MEDLELAFALQRGFGGQEYLASHCLQCRARAPSVFADGQIHTYVPEVGTWQVLEDAAFSRKLYSLKITIDQLLAAQAAQTGSRPPDPEPLAYGRLISIKSHIRDLLYQRDFFDQTHRAAFTNGQVSIEADGTATLRQPCHYARVRHQFRCSYVEQPTPKWIRLLQGIWAGDADMDDKIQLLHEFIGAAIMGRATDFKRCLVFYGDGRNGKSTIQSVVEAIFPPAVICHSNPQLWHGEYARAELAGKVLNITSELPERELMESEAFKTIVEGGTIQARIIRERPFEFRPKAANLFATNNLLRVADHTEGFFRRFIIVPFNNRFEQGVDMAEPIIADELPGIAFRAITAFRQALARGLKYTIPPSSTTAMEQWKLESDPVAQFREACLEYDEAGSIPTYEIWKNWEGWAVDHGFKPVNAAWFGRKLVALMGPKVVDRSKQQRYYRVRRTAIGGVSAQNYPYPTM